MLIAVVTAYLGVLDFRPGGQIQEVRSELKTNFKLSVGFLFGPWCPHVQSSIDGSIIVKLAISNRPQRRDVCSNNTDNDVNIQKEREHNVNVDLLLLAERILAVLIFITSSASIPGN